MTTTTGMLAFRSAAALAHALPTIRLRIRDGDRILLEVAHRPAGPPADLALGEVQAGQTISACAFRAAVARARRLVEAGVQLRFLDLPAGHVPAIDIGVAPGDAILPGGIIRAEGSDHVLYAFATALTVDRCKEAIAERLTAGRDRASMEDVATDVVGTEDVATDVMGTEDMATDVVGTEAADGDARGYGQGTAIGYRFGFHEDAAAGMTVVHALASETVPSDLEPFMAHLHEVCMVAELLDELAASSLRGAEESR